MGGGEGRWENWILFHGIFSLCDKILVQNTMKSLRGVNSHLQTKTKKRIMKNGKG